MRIVLAGKPYQEIFFSKSEFRDRLYRLRNAMKKAGLDVLLTHAPENTYYYTGFRSQGYAVYCHSTILPLEGDPIIIHSEQEELSIKATSWTKRASLYREADDPAKHTAKTLRKEGFASSKIGVDQGSWFLKVADYQTLTKNLPNASFRDCTALVGAPRVIKSKAEVDFIRKASKASDASMKAAVEVIEQGITEGKIASEVFRAGIESGSEYYSHPPFICSGPRSGITHATWSDRRLRKGDIVHLELSGCIHRYTGVQIRTAVVGKASDKLKRWDKVCLTALERSIEVMKPGVSGKKVDDACWRVFREAGLDVPYHFTAYSIGIGFPPDWGDHLFYCWRGESTPVGYSQLKPGMILHVTGPVMYIENTKFGYSDTVLINEDGCEVLTSAERLLFEN